MFKDDPAPANAAVPPAHPFGAPLPGGTLGALARSYNRIGGLADLLAQQTQIDPVAVLSVWYVASGGAAFVAGQPIIRFEVHKFYAAWGAQNRAAFDAHFQFGGHDGVPGKSYQNHKFRPDPNTPWATFHGTQAGEYKVFNFAAGLANLEAASLSTSFGGPQIMGSNHNDIGYATATALRAAFSAEERWQVLGFFDFCQHNGLIGDIRTKNWNAFGAGYNGNGAVYGPRIGDAFTAGAKLTTLPRQ